MPQLKDLAALPPDAGRKMLRLAQLAATTRMLDNGLDSGQRDIQTANRNADYSRGERYLESPPTIAQRIAAGVRKLSELVSVNSADDFLAASGLPGIPKSTPRTLEAAAEAWESHFFDVAGKDTKYGLRAINSGELPKPGQTLKNSWHPAGEVEGFPKDTRLDGTAAFDLKLNESGMRDVEKAVRNAQSYWPDVKRFAIIHSDQPYGRMPLPEDGGVLLKRPKVLAVFELD